MNKTVIVIFGGDSTESEISVISGVEALNAMPIKGIKTVPIYLYNGKMYTGDRLAELKTYVNFSVGSGIREVFLANHALYGTRWGKPVKLAAVDCALLLTHGGIGENGTLQGYLELNNIPYSSSGVGASALCMDKILTKSAIKSLGIPVVPGREVSTPLDEETLETLEDLYNYPMIVKPASQGSSIGITLAKNADELKEGVTLAAEFDKKILVERGLRSFTELNCAAVTINSEVVLSEIEKPVTAGDFLSFSDKYLGGVKGLTNACREFPAKISDETRELILKYTEKAYKSLGLFGIVRIDYLVEDGEVYLNEINTIPGSLAHYLFPSYSHTNLLRAITDETLIRKTNIAKAFHTDILKAIGVKIRK